MMPRKKKEEEVTTAPVIKEPNPKTIAIQELIKRGYDAYYDAGIVMCKWRDDDTFIEVRKILDEIGYRGSFGVVADDTKEAKQVSGRPKDARLKELKDKGETIYSISRLDTMNNCKYEAYRTYILHEHGKDNIYACLGTKLHDTLEKITKGEATEADLLPVMKEELNDMDMLGLSFPKDRNDQDTIRDNWIKNISHFCKTYKAPKNKNLKTEELFIWTSPKGYKLQGYIDLSWIHDDGSISIFDYKTSTKYNGKDIENHARQLILYALGKEQEGYKVKSINWVFLKYAQLSFMGYKTAKSKEKTKIVKDVERRKIGAELSKYIAADMKELGYDELDINIILDKIRKEGYDESIIPEELRKNYIVKPCVVSVELTDESRKDTIDYIEQTIEEWIKLDETNEQDYPPRKFTRVKSSSGEEALDMFYCTQLCSHFDKCGYAQDFLNQWQEDDNFNDDLF